jgi:hypothetical protein
MKIRPSDATPVSVPTSTAAKAPEAAKAAAPAPAATAAQPTASFSSASNAAKPTDIAGAAAGHVAPHQVESPFSPGEKQALAKKIPCPALAGMFQAGMLKTAKDGTVKIPDLERALSGLGPSAAVRVVLTRGADATDSIPGSFNLFNLNGSNLDHTGSTGIRANGVHPERFDALWSHSKDGVRLTAKDLADANEAFAKEDPGFRGRITGQTEFAIVLQVFGQTAKDGTKFFSKDDAKSLFVDGQIPKTWSPPVTPGKVSLVDVLGGSALGMFRQLINGQ